MIPICCATSLYIEYIVYIYWGKKKETKLKQKEKMLINSLVTKLYCGKANT